MEQQGAAAPPRPAKPAQGGPPARVHRVAGRPPPVPLPALALNPPVSLERPRPPAERRLNTYVEAPPRSARPPEPDKRGAVTAQPVPAPAKRTERSPCQRPPDSIICERCGRCRCAQCARPRALPSRWLGDLCLCSAETAIDYASCMCCVKALLYHCCSEGDSGSGAGEEGESCADEPCSCSGGRCGARWGCLAALAAVLPCLWCYWPLRGAAALCQGAYAHTRPSGCRCRPRAPDKLPLAPDPLY